MPADSQEAVAAAVATALRDHGWGVATDARRLRASLSDLLGAHADEHRGALDAVVLVVEEGLVGELRQAGQEGAGEVLPGMVERLGAWGLAAEPAEWALRVWSALLPEPTRPPAATAEPAETRAPAPAPTTLPPVATAPTQLPPSTGTSGRTGRRFSGRGVVVAAAVVIAVGVVGGVAAAVNWGDRRAGTGPSPDRTSASDVVVLSETPPPAAEAGTVVAVQDTAVPAPERRAAMAARSGGVRLARLGEVETVGSGQEARTAPEGGSLIGFRLADWPCDEDSCRPWSRLGLRVAVGDSTRRLPVAGGKDTFVVAVPEGEERVDLVMKADGLTQRLSLLTGRPGPRNIVVLARSRRVVRIGESFTLTERTSVAFDYDGTVTDTVPREVKVTRAELTYFTEQGHPSSPKSAYLKVRADYTIPLGADAGERFAFDIRELTFVARDGTTYRAVDLDRGPGVSAAFEVPATLKGGTFRMGGSYATSSNGLGYTVTLASRSIRLSFA